MEIVGFLLANLVSIAITTGVLCGALLLIGEEINSNSLGKAVMTVGFATLVWYVPYVGLILFLMSWFIGLISFFEKSFLEALIISLICFGVFLFVRLYLVN